MQEAETSRGEEGRDALFGHLPPSLFGILSSPAKRAYARLILAIYRRFFTEGFAEIHRADEVTAFIEAELDRNAEIQRAVGEANNTDVSQNPAIAYKNLKEAGWLIEHRQGYVAVVDLDASVAMLLETLSAIEHGEAIHFNGTIAAIESVVENLRKDPVERAATLADSAHRSRRFQQHLSAVVSSLRAYEKLILSKPDPAHILARFFDDFVERMLISDYRALKMRNNPFRHRDRIVAAVGLYEADEEMLFAFAEGYIQQGLARDHDSALAKVREHLYQVKSTFLRVEDRLDDIDAFRVRLERKITRTIAYMSQVDSGLPARLSSIIQHLGARVPEWSSPVPVVSHLLDPVRTWGPANLWTPRTRRTTAAPVPIQIEEDDPIISEWDRLKRDYLARLTVTPQKIMAFLDRSMDGKEVMSAGDLDVADTEQALIFQRLRLLGAVGDPVLARRYRVIVRDRELIETDWSICSDFRIERVEPQEGTRHAV